MHRILFVTILLIATFNIYPSHSNNNLEEEGTALIKGRVIDKKTGEELIGATIIIDGTLTGTITDFDGNYVLRNLDPGKYNIRCSYISYQSILIKDIELKPGDEFVLDFSMSEETMGIDEVVVKAKQITRTENALLSIQRKSANVIDGISSQEMSRMGDSDAGGSLKRVTGISVQGGKYVYVRGLSDRYTKTLLNNAEIPGLDPDRNTVQMDLFPTNLIENMIVHKTFTNELPGSFTGGIVNIVTKDFPEKYTFNFSTSVAYNPQANLNDDFLSYEGGNLDWLGIDDGTRDLPDGVDDVPYYPLEKERLDEITKSFGKEMSPSLKKSSLNHSHSISVGNQVDFLGKPLGFIVGLSYSRKFKNYDNGRKELYQQLGDSATSLSNQHSYSDHKSTMEVMVGAIANASWKLNNNNSIGLTLIRNQSGESTARYMYGSKNSDDVNLNIETRTLQYLQRELNSAQFRGDHTFKNKMKLVWLSSSTLSRQEEPDLRYFTNSYRPGQTGSNQYSIDQSIYKLPSRYFRLMKEFNFDNKVDFTLPFDLYGLEAKFKYGGGYLFKYRDFTDSRYDYWFQFSGENYNGSVEDFLSDENIGLNAIDDENTKYGIYIQDGTDEKNSYTGKQSIISGYSMVELPVHTKLRLIAGLRVEQANIFVESEDSKYDKGELNDFDILPAFNLTLSATEKSNIRLVYTRTLARPSFRELAPYASEDFAGGEISIGNPDLERTLIDNLDIRYEIFPGLGEIASISGFYKKFTNPIEVVDNPIANNPELTWRNVDEAQVYGIEAEFRKSLGFIHLLKDFKLGANFTYLQSVVDIDPLELEGMPEGTADTRSMSEQPSYIFNSSLSYKNDSIGLAANVGFNVTGEKIVVVVKGVTPDILEQPKPDLNFNISQRFAKNWKVKFSIKNILDSKHKEIYRLNGKEYIYRLYSTGRTFSIGVSYSL